MPDEFDHAQALEQRRRDEALARVRASMNESTTQLLQCEDCGNDIPQARRQAIPGVTRCVYCQNEFERKRKAER